MVDDETKYEEAGRFHRYILNWRHAGLAGFLVAMYAVGNVLVAFADHGQYLLGSIVALLSALLGVAFSFIDARNREIYITATEAARALENRAARASKTPRATGLYTHLHAMNTGNNLPTKWGPHTRVLMCTYLGSSVVLLAVCFYMVWRSFGK